MDFLFLLPENDSLFVIAGLVIRSGHPSLSYQRCSQNVDSRDFQREDALRASTRAVTGFARKPYFMPLRFVMLSGRSGLR
jgi:hypothetical protein